MCLRMNGLLREIWKFISTWLSSLHATLDQESPSISANALYQHDELLVCLMWWFWPTLICLRVVVLEPVFLLLTT